MEVVACLFIDSSCFYLVGTIASGLKSVRKLMRISVLNSRDIIYNQNQSNIKLRDFIWDEDPSVFMSDNTSLQGICNICSNVIFIMCFDIRFLISK